MEWMRILLSRLGALFQRRRLDADLDEELAAHVELAVAENRRRGMSQEDARTAALRAFGGVTQTRERYRMQQSWVLLEHVGRDLRFGLRQLRKSPVFTLAAVLTLALGIGANTAVFTVLNAVLIRPLPFSAGDRLVRVSSVKDGVEIGPSPPDVRDFVAQNRTFDGLAIYDHWRKNVTTSRSGGTPEQAHVGLASAEFFEVLGVQPILGRLFTPEETHAGRNHVALITQTFWRSRYASDPAVLGRTLEINDEPYAVVGVLPDIIPVWMDGSGASVGIWEPFLPVPSIWDESSRGGRDYQAVGRLKPGVTIKQGQADLGRIAANLAATYPIDRGFGVALQPLIASRAGDLKPQLFLLMGAVLLILLIACSNLAALLLARNTARQREFAMKAALGASRLTLVRQILTETLLLSLLGGGSGIALAWGASILLRQRHPQSMPQLADIGLDWRVLLFTLVVAISASLLFGLAPAIFNTRVNLLDALKRGGRGSSSVRQSFRKVLVVTQVAFSLVLMVAAALLTQTIMRLEDQELGFGVDHLVKAHFYLPPVQYPSPSAIDRFCAAYAERLRALPGVRDASVTTVYPPKEGWRMMFTRVDRSVSRLEDVPSTLFGVTDAHYLRTLEIPLIKGRDFSESDTETSFPVAMVNQAFARRYFADEDPVGRRLELGAPTSLTLQDRWMSGRTMQVEIVGVMGDTKDQGLAQAVEPQLITLFRQTPLLNFGFKDIVVRATVSAQALNGAMQEQLHALDPRLPLSEFGSMVQHIEEQTSDKRVTNLMLISFAGIGLVLAMVGIYGVISYLVAQRTQELGIRLALGAARGAVLWLIVRQGLMLAGFGVGLGLIGTAMVGRSLSGLLYGISALDGLTLIAASAFLLLVALAASAIPAKRAMQIDPMRALRTE